MIIDGAAIASAIQKNIAHAIGRLTHRPPGLAFVMVGENPASRTYIRMKKKECAAVGILSIDIELPETVSEETLQREIDKLNRDPAIDGILIQLPLPDHLATFRILSAVDPKKDVDGFHPINAGKMLMGEQDGFLPCTPLGIHVLLTQSLIPVHGKHVVIVGRSNIVGKPLAAILMQKAPHCNATVTVAHSMSENLSTLCQSADILVAAIGKPKFITAPMVKEGAVVIDVGINRVGHGQIIGDVDFENVSPKASHITPVPKGVGPMTIAMLLSNTLLSYQRKVPF
jgi:methylenetetrahydrofolate dehydrogenase (NADP+)/methenyltetrahydrofolate cyclohydrolase